MNTRYEFFEHTADIGVHVYGADLPELFRNAVMAMHETLGELKKSEGQQQKSIEVQAESLEDLLHEWLAELLFEVEVHHRLFDEIQQVGTGGLTATVRGGAIDFSRSHLREEIKAITYHKLRVEQLPDGTWRATVIFDV